MGISQHSRTTMELYTNMADASQNIPPEKPELFGYYIQIPEKAEVRRVPISMLSSSVQKRIMRLGGYMDCSKAPYVIVVSPITMEKLPNSHKARTTMAERAAEHTLVTFSDTSQSSGGRSSTGTADKWTMKDHGTYIVPVKCSKDTARTILQMSQTNNEEKLSLKDELQTLRDSFVLNLQVINMKATALGMYENVMYLLPESNKTNISDDKSEEREKVERSEVADPQPEVRDCKAEEMEQKVCPKTSQSNDEHNGMNCVPPRRSSSLQQSHKLEVGATFVNPWNEDIWDLPAERNSTNGSPSSRPSTENNVKLHLMSHSEQQRKRKFSSGESSESFIKKVHLIGCGPKQDTTEEKNDFTHSPVQPPLSSGSPSPFGPQETTPSRSPSTSSLDIENVDLEGLSPFSFSSSSSSYNISLRAAPAPQEPDPTCEDNMSPSYLKVKSSPSLSEYTTSPESENSLIFQRKFSSRSSKETFIKKIGSDSKQDSTVVRNDFTHSPVQPHLSSGAPSPLGPQESPPSLSPATSPLDRKIADLEELSPPPSSSLLCNIPLCAAPAHLGSDPTCEDNMSPSNLKSSPSLSEYNTGSESGHEPDEMAPSSENSQIVHHLRSEDASFLDIDDTTRDEKTQRLLDRVRELDKIVENLRQREKLS